MSSRSVQADLQRKDAELRKLINLSSLTVAPLKSDFDHAIDKWRQDPKFTVLVAHLDSLSMRCN